MQGKYRGKKTINFVSFNIITYIINLHSYDFEL